MAQHYLDLIPVFEQNEPACFWYLEFIQNKENYDQLQLLLFNSHTQSALQNNYIEFLLQVFKTAFKVEEPYFLQIDEFNLYVENFYYSMSQDKIIRPRPSSLSRFLNQYLVLKVQDCSSSSYNVETKLANYHQFF